MVVAAAARVEERRGVAAAVGIEQAVATVGRRGDEVSATAGRWFVKIFSVSSVLFMVSLASASGSRGPDDVEELLLDSFRLAGMNSGMWCTLLSVSRCGELAWEVSCRLTGREIPGAAPEVQRS